MLGLLGRCTPLWVGNVRNSQVNVEFGSALSGRNSPAAQLREKGWSTAVYSMQNQQQQCCASSKRSEGSAAPWGDGWGHWEGLVTQTAPLTAYLPPPACQGALAERLLRGWAVSDIGCGTSNTFLCSAPCDRGDFTSGRGSAGDLQPAEPWLSQHTHLVCDRSGHMVLLLWKEPKQMRWSSSCFCANFIAAVGVQARPGSAESPSENLSKFLR